jgi:hypothetical protein
MSPRIGGRSGARIASPAAIPSRIVERAAASLPPEDCKSSSRMKKSAAIG